MLFLNKNLCCGCSSELPWRGNSNKHLQHRFYEDLTKIIFQLSSNIIKYAPYLFFCNIIGSFVLKSVLSLSSDRVSVFCWQVSCYPPIQSSYNLLSTVLCYLPIQSSYNLLSKVLCYLPIQSSYNLLSTEMVRIILACIKLA